MSFLTDAVKTAPQDVIHQGRKRASKKVSSPAHANHPYHVPSAVATDSSPTVFPEISDIFDFGAPPLCVRTTLTLFVSLLGQENWDASLYCSDYLLWPG